MARLGEEFPLLCPNCGGDIRLIAFITQPGPIRKILTHLGEPLEPPPLSPARGPPTDGSQIEPEGRGGDRQRPGLARGRPQNIFPFVIWLALGQSKMTLPPPARTRGPSVPY